jgi:hypothetical protein
MYSILRESAMVSACNRTAYLKYVVKKFSSLPYRLRSSFIPDT